MEATQPRVVLATFGTHGDLHPFIAVALALKQRGVRPFIAASELYRTKVEAEGIGFHHMRPDLEAVAARLGMDQVTMARAVARAPEFILQDIMLPHLRESYEDALAALRDADLAVLHSTAYAAKLAAEKLGVPHVGVALQPMILMSTFDPPVIGNLPRLSQWVYRRGHAVTRAFIALGKLMSRRWARPIDALREKLDLPVAHGHPFFEGHFSELGAIALFSPLFGAPQPDHPGRTRIVGFPFYDSEAAGAPTLSAELQRFLDSGPAPLVFTQGTSAIQDAEHFVRESLAAVRLLDARAVFVLDEERVVQWRPSAPATALITGYAPYSLLFPRARINVHHGGVGTTAQALRAGRPQLISPYLVDQPDNAARVERLGAGRTLDKRQYRAERVVQEIRRLDSNAYAERAAAVGEIIAREDGAGAAADILVKLLRESRRAP